MDEESLDGGSGEGDEGWEGSMQRNVAWGTAALEQRSDLLLRQHSEQTSQGGRMTDGGGATKAAGRRVSRLPSSPARAPPHLRSRRAPGGSAGTRAGGGCPPGAAVSGCWRSGPSCGSRLPPPSPRPGTPSATEKRHHSPTAAPGRAGPSRAGVTPVRFSPARLYPSRLSGSTRGLPLSPTAAPVPPDPAVTSAPLRRPPAPSTSLTEPQWRRRRAVRMRLESRAHR